MRFLRFLRPHKGTLGLAVLFMAISSLFDWVSIAMFVPVVDKVFNNGKIVFPVGLPSGMERLISLINSMSQMELLRIIILIMPVLFLLKGLFNFLYSYYMSDIGQLCVRDIRNRLYEKIQGLSLEYFIKKRTGELISRITNDVKLVENALSYGTTDLVYQSFLVVVFSFTIFYIHWRLALVSLLLLPMVALPIIKVGRVLRKISRRSQDKMADINSLLVETISGARIVKAFCMEDHEIEKFRSQNQGYYKLSMKSIKRTLLLSPATELIGVIFGVFILAWVGKDVISGKISFGVFGLFLGSLFSLIRPLKKLSQVSTLNQQALVASSRVYDVLDTVSTVAEGPQAPLLAVIKHKIVYEGVNFSYGSQPVLEDINIEIKKGEVLAIVGKSGVGKSTLVDLLPRFYDPGRGRILIDGVDIRGVSLRSLRGQMGIVTQETILFNDTIRENIAYGRKDAKDAQIMEAAKKAHAHEFIESLPDAYDTLIGDRGAKLSGGEKQRLCIARALLKDPPILILDEATSQLDSTSERIVQEALDTLIAGRTVFIIAHRLSTVRSADRIIVLDAGRIVEQGSHEELLGQNGLYKQLYSLQEIG